MLVSIRIVSILALAFCSTVVNAQSRCSTPERIPGQCVSVYSCPSVLSLFQGQVTPSVAEYLRSLQCVSNVGEYPHVCCIFPSASTPRPPATPKNRFSSGTGNILPTTCQVTTTEDILGDRVVGGVDARLEDYPWTVLLEYQTRLQENKLSCGGSLINTRYVLTAAHCLVGDIEKLVGKLVSIRLGEYDLRSEVDCIEGKCADPVVVMGVEEKIPHEGYVAKNKNRQYDIGLVRMDGEVTYSEYIRPICLPATVYSPVYTPNEIFASAGWGRTLTKRQSATKQKIYLPLFDQTQCIEQFRQIGVVVDGTQICAGGIEEQDTCDGDSGNALMRIASSSWIIEGIVSYGRKCGLQDRPAVYTRVSAFDQWIRSKLRP